MLDSSRIASRCLGLVVLSFAPAAGAYAQTYVSTPGQIPASQGHTESCDLGDVDGDGDLDAVFADGADFGPEQNRLWINRGFEPGGTIGNFADRSAAQLPAVLDQTHEVDLVDLDADGDLDLVVSNSSASGAQPSRFWVNMGGAQGGTPGFFQDQTGARWTFVGVNDGLAHFSSVAASQVLPGNGFLDWSRDSVLGDLDADGDLDLVHSSYGANAAGDVPTRVFTNDGQGYFEEFNPSHHQLAGAPIFDGEPALWCLGQQKHGTLNTTGAYADVAQPCWALDLGDIDGDFDLDVLLGARVVVPRYLRNRMVETGSFGAFLDATYSTGYNFALNGTAHDEQEFADFDRDDDLDLYGVDWKLLSVFPTDRVVRNNGSGVYEPNAYETPLSFDDDSEADAVDYDNDGDLDVFVTSPALPARLHRNDTAGSFAFAHVGVAQLPSFSIALGSDSGDLDADGDYDLLVARDAAQPELLLLNTSQVLDTTAPRLALEQVPDRAAGPLPTFVCVHVYDNSSWDAARYDALTLEYSWNSGLEWHSGPMRFSGGQLFRGPIRGDIAGTIQYRVRAVDEHGNAVQSVTKSFNASGCTGNVSTYCTPGTTWNSCNATMIASGLPSIGAPSGFVLTATAVEGRRPGMIFYGTSGRQAVPWGAGTSFLCVKPPTQRTTITHSGGTAGICDGSLVLDWLAYLSTHPGALGQPFAPGRTVDAQGWFRDPLAPNATNLSNGLEFTTCP